MKTLLVVMLLAGTTFAQNPAQSGGASSDKVQAAERAHAAPALASQVPAPRTEDVKSQGALLGAIYDVISGPVGERDWNRFRSLFVPQARFTALRRAPDGSVGVALLNVDEFIQAAGEVFKSEAFYERAAVNRVQTFGNMAQVFSSYESRHAPGQQPFERGINSIQMLNDGKRWWVLSILWDRERPDNPLPAEFAAASAK